MKTILHIFILLIQTGLNAHAHSPDADVPISESSCLGRDPFCQSANISSNNGKNIMNAGYGYFGHPNDEELNSFEFGCSSRQRMSYMNVFCGGVRPGGGRRDSTKVMMQLVRPMFEAKVRKAFFEKMKYEALATGSTEPTVPACLQDQLDLVNPSVLEMNLQYDRKSMVAEQFSSPSILRALYASDRIEKLLSDYCPEGKKDEMCVSAKNILDRIKMNFPMMFPPPTFNNGVRTMDPGAPHRVKIRKAFFQAIGAQESRSASAEEQIKIGGKFYQENLNQGEIPGGLAFDEKLISMSDALSGNPALKKAQEEMEKKVKAMNKDYIKGSKERFHKCNYGMGLVCKVGASPEKLCDANVIHAAMGNYPNVVRQALADMSAQEREGAKLLMCRWDLLKTYRNYRCQGVTSGQTTPRTVQVKKVTHSYPFQNNVNYTIVEGDPEGDIPHIIKSKIYVVNKSGMADKDFRKDMAAKAKAVSAWYTKQAESRNMEVQIEFVATTDEKLAPSLNINKCYRTEIQSSDCAEVHKYYCQKKICEGKADFDKCFRECMVNKADGGAEFNRENAGNLTENSTPETYNHEMGHLLGLDDEYQTDRSRYKDLSSNETDDPNTFLPDSIMQVSTTGVLRARHLNQLIAPLQCADQD